MTSKELHPQRIGLVTAFSIVVANMIGTGVFTSLGFQVADIKSPFVLLMLWVVGGMIALSGALSYSELASSLPRSGGEYHFLSRIYHPFLGFLAGWVSVLVGFSAPTALAAMALAEYMKTVMPSVNSTVFAVIVIIILSTVHSFQIKYGGWFQRLVTLIKILLIIVFIIAGLYATSHTSIYLLPAPSGIKELFSPSFAVSLIFVSYAFSGWNAAVYITNEIKNIRKNIPAALISGTILVTLLYVMLNYVFLYTTPIQEMAGKIEIGFLSATHIFGGEGGKIMALVISLLLVSSVSAMIWIGPRVSMVMGEDYRLMKFLGKTNRHNVPVNAIWLQAVLSIILIISSTFDKVLVYTGFTLNIFTLLCVTGVFILRMKPKRFDKGFRLPGFPVVPLIFIGLSLWTMIFLIVDRTTESITGLITVLTGGIFFFIDRITGKR